MLFRPKDPRARHLRRLRRSRAAARAWTVWAATFGASAAVAVPYAGLGWLDIGWAGAAGGSLAFAVLRWKDHRALRLAPMPAALPPRPPAQRLASRLAPVVGPALSSLVDRPRRIPVHRASAAAPVVDRLNQATRAMPHLLDKLGPHAGDTGREAAAAHAALRRLAVRVTVVEQTLPVAPVESREALLDVRSGLVGQLDHGVRAYERLAGAAAECVAALARGGDTLAVSRLTEAGDALRGLAAGLTEIKDQNTAHGIPG
jgi:hypothetical protein